MQKLYVAGKEKCMVWLKFSDKTSKTYHANNLNDASRMVNKAVDGHFSQFGMTLIRWAVYSRNGRRLLHSSH